MSELTEQQYSELEADYWDAYQIERARLEYDEADMFDELSAATTRICRRAGIRRLVDELRAMEEAGMR